MQDSQPKSRKRKTVNYIDNEEFYKAIVEWKKECREAEDAGEEMPQITNYLGECIYKIATNMARMGKFSGYSYKDEMISDAIETMVLYFDKFDEEKYNNPFNYYSQITYFSFLRRINKEKRNQYIKYKMIERSLINDSLVNRGIHDEGVGDSSVEFDVDNINSFIQDYEDKLEEKREKARKG